MKKKSSIFINTLFIPYTLKNTQFIEISNKQASVFYSKERKTLQIGWSIWLLTNYLT